MFIQTQCFVQMLQNRLRKEKKIFWISVAELNWCLFVLARLLFSVWRLAA